MVARKTVCLRRLGGNRGGELQAGRFLANPKVTAAKIVEGWSRLTGPASAGRHVLAIQDTTEVKFPTRAERRRGLGPVKQGNTQAGQYVWRAGARDDCGGRCQPRLPRPGGRRCLDPSGRGNGASSGSSAVGAGIATLAGDGGAGEGGTGVRREWDGAGTDGRRVG